MNKKLIFGIAGIAAIIIVSILYLVFIHKPAQQSAPVPQSPATVEVPTTTNPNSVPTTPGSYQDYSPNAVQSAQGTKLLFFYAPWCPQCRQLDADIKKSGVPEGVTIFKVDYDSRQDLRMQYGVTIQTTIIKISSDGSLVKKYVAYEHPTLESVIKNLLP